VADLEGERAPTPVIWVTKEKMTEGRKAGRASKTNLPPTTATVPATKCSCNKSNK